MPVADTILQAYSPLLLWTGLGLLLCPWLPDTLPRLLGRSLYWVGVPLQIFTLARFTDWDARVGLAPVITVATLVAGMAIAWFLLQSLLRLRSNSTGHASDDHLFDPEMHPARADSSSEISKVSEISSISDISEAQNSDKSDQENLPISLSPPPSWQNQNRQGSFVLSSMLGNTGFVGLAIAPTFVDEHYLSWIVFYSVTHNVVGTYGLGVFLASYFGRQDVQRPWWAQLRDVLTVPSLWAFVLGYLTHPWHFPNLVDQSLHISILVVIPIALLLMGMRLSQLKGWHSLRSAVAPAIIKVLLLPALVGIVTTWLHLAPAARLAMVLMSGMPTAFGGLILAEEYDLDRDLIASSIVLSTLGLLLAIPLWLWQWG